MKINLILFLFMLSFNSCKENSEKQLKLEIHENLEPVVGIDELISDYNTWWSYHYYDISLSSDFNALNEKSEDISKEDFLRKLTSGKFIPVEMNTNNVKTYQLYKLPKGVDKAIASTIKTTATSAYNFYKMEGQNFPEINFIDLNGNRFTNDNLKGKTTVVKTWFIACKPCIEEMPELNNLVDRLEQNKSFQFISLALDEEQPLKEFITKNEFKYAVIPDQERLIQNRLKLRAYPTHLIIDEKGKIKKVFATASELMDYMEKDGGLIEHVNEENLLSPPPPPPAPLKQSINKDV